MSRHHCSGAAPIEAPHTAPALLNAIAHKPRLPPSRVPGALGLVERLEHGCARKP